MNRTQQIAEAFDQLFRTYPQSDRGEPEQLAHERVERAKAYFEAVSPYETEDILQAVHHFLTGSAPGQNPAWAPSAPSVGAESRRVMNLRLDAERRRVKPALPPPHRVPPEKRAEMAQRLRDLAAKLRYDGAA